MKPDEWISELEIIRQRLKGLKSRISDTDFMTHILNNLPPEYETTIEKLEDDLVNDSLTVELLREKLRMKHERIMRNKENDTTKDTALMTATSGVRGGTKTGYFKGRCTKCGRYGHKAKDCTDNQPNKLKCNYCKISGHKEKDCRKKKSCLLYTSPSPRDS